ncbi:MAG: hypothetical protein M3Q30_25025 [Actinomycetota bacterium]|nr:hypothetical protein [Actinomycetota bacterium]
MPLNVMVLESERGAADQAALDLTEAGHVALRCHEPGAPAFPCRGVEDQSSCPVLSHAVDVALTVRLRPRSQPAPQEDGVRCALMHHVPLVVAGSAVLDPYEGYEARLLDRDGDVVGACEEVAAAELPRHTRVASEALQTTQSADDARADARASVTRRCGSLLVSVSGLEGLAPRRREAAVVRMLARLRELDSTARGIDVVLTSPT